MILQTKKATLYNLVLLKYSAIVSQMKQYKILFCKNELLKDDWIFLHSTNESCKVI